MKSLLKQKIYELFDGNEGGAILPKICFALLEEQKASWKKLSYGYDALTHVRERDIHCGGFSVKIQFNPARILSCTAPVDPGSINNRPCFLCTENLPEEQRGILYRRNYLILCNPFPIFRKHYTVSHVKHIPQSIAGAINTFLSLAKDLHPHFNVYYNGPQCGASAPDHLHFQAAPSEALPIENEVRNDENRLFVKLFDDVSICSFKNLGREVVLLEGKNSDRIEKILSNLIEAMKASSSLTGEPMINLLCSYKENAFQVIIFPRRKHRPGVYFLPGDDRILISPGLVDMGGFVITPVEKDFVAIDGRLLQDIYQEVSIDAETVNEILDSVSLND